MLNLITDSWLPVIRLHSGRCTIRPAEIADHHDDDPVIAIDWPRPDFRVATLEFLVGLLTTAFPPGSSNAWTDFWEVPPEPARLDEAFTPFVHAFDLDGDGPRFLQDMEDLVADAGTIERLLIEMPGESTIEKNRDLLVHRGQVASLGRPAAAIALYTLQSYASSGGSGHHVGLRGGGPLVTMIMPGVAPTLWQTVWANVPSDKQVPTQAEFPLIFPWLAQTITSEPGAPPVTPQSAHPLQCWWGMPRRIRLDFVAHPTPQICDLTGTLDTVQVVSWRQRSRGTIYAMWGGVHPLTPHYHQKVGAEKLPVHAQPWGIGYQHWLGLVMATPDGLRLPADTVRTWRVRCQEIQVKDARIMAGGYDMERMTARSFVEAVMPLPSTRDMASQDRLDDLAKRLVESADLVSWAVRSAVRNALFSPGARISPDADLLNTVRERFWGETERRFFSLLEVAAQRSDELPETDRDGWLKHMRDTALALFDEAAPLWPDSDAKTAQRIGKARKLLRITLAGYGPAGAKLREKLILPDATPKESKKKRKGP